MSKRLIMLKTGTTKTFYNKLNCIYDFSNQSMGCGNCYKEGLKHKFYSDDITDVVLLINIIRRFKFKTIITDITKNSFEFENKTENEQIFFFRICRYVRTNLIKKILEDTIMINKSGVKIQNAFLLAHYYNYKNTLYMSIPYYNMGMDGFYDTSKNNYFTLNKPYKLLKDFKSNFNKPKLEGYQQGMGFCYLYKFSEKNKNSEKKLLFELLEEKDFKAAEKYLLKVFK